MPRRVSKEKEMVALVRNLQDKVEDLSGIFGGESHLNSHAYNQLSLETRCLFEKLKVLFNDVEYITHQLSESRMFLSATNDPRYHKRQVANMEHKMRSNNHIQCECGEFIHRKFYDDHRARNKCIQSRLRIAYKQARYPIFNVVDIGKAMIVNCHINTMVNNPKCLTGYKYYCLEELVRKYKANKRRLLENDIMFDMCWEIMEEEDRVYLELHNDFEAVLRARGLN